MATHMAIRWAGPSVLALGMVMAHCVCFPLLLLGLAHTASRRLALVLAVGEEDSRDDDQPTAQHGR